MMFHRNTVQAGDALDLLRSLAVCCSPLIIFDPQHRNNLDKLKYGNEGARQRERCLLPQMTGEYVEQCCRESVRALRPSGYLMLWQNAFLVGTAWHKCLGDVLKCVDLIAWDNQRISNGCRARRRGDYVVVLQKPPLKARATWRTMPSIPDRWVEKVDRKLHPHIKPVGLIRALIEAITAPGDLVIDPAAGSFVVMHAAIALGREFIGCDIALRQPELPIFDAPTIDNVFTRYLDAQSRILAAHRGGNAPDDVRSGTQGLKEGPSHGNE
jgi:site-specific DNA-methyltransferase (adenine-specific)